MDQEKRGRSLKTGELRRICMENYQSLDFIYVSLDKVLLSVSNYTSQLTLKNEINNFKCNLNYIDSNSLLLR